jgi:hypothetical protein
MACIPDILAAPFVLALSFFYNPKNVASVSSTAFAAPSIAPNEVGKSVSHDLLNLCSKGSNLTARLRVDSAVHSVSSIKISSISPLG